MISEVSRDFEKGLAPRSDRRPGHQLVDHYLGLKQ